jgi:hypothetical protein
VEREQRFGWKASGWHAPIFDLHVAALQDAGFREVGVIWQNGENRVLMAVRSPARLRRGVVLQW